VKEFLLHRIWQHQAFQHQQLLTTTGQRIIIISPGDLNRDSGPDFSNACVVIDGLIWHGDVELHIRESDWNRHQHQQDPAYNKVILHVTWEAGNSAVVYREDGSTVPCLALGARMCDDALKRMQLLMNSMDSIPCYPLFPRAAGEIVDSMFQNSLQQRVQQKIYRTLQVLKITDYDWEEVSYRLMVERMGFLTNNRAFYRLAELLPLDT